jgi:hypothetical protein
VAQSLHDGEGVGTSHGHLRPEGVPKPMNANVGDACAFAGHIKVISNVGQQAFPPWEDQRAFYLPLLGTFPRHLNGFNRRLAEWNRPSRVVGLRSQRFLLVHVEQSIAEIHVAPFKMPDLSLP